MGNCAAKPVQIDTFPALDVRARLALVVDQIIDIMAGTSNRAAFGKAITRPLLSTPFVHCGFCLSDAVQGLTFRAFVVHLVASNWCSDGELVGLVGIITTCGQQAATFPRSHAQPDEHWADYMTGGQTDGHIWCS